MGNTMWIKTFLEKIFSFLMAGTKQSSMRLGFVMAFIGGLYILIMVGRYIKMFADKTVELNNWTEMGLFVTGVGVMMTGVAYMKVAQKKTEVEQENKVKNDGE